MRFLVSPSSRLDEEMVDQAYLTGFDRAPWLARVQAQDGVLTLERRGNESANLHVPWLVPGHGRLMLSTGSLIEKSVPYQLPLELARGKLGQLRNQLADWEMIGLSVPEALDARIQAAHDQFNEAISASGDPAQSAALADRALGSAVDAAEFLVACYTEQAMSVRRRGKPMLPCCLGGDLGIALLEDSTAGHFLETFNAASVPLRWREIEPVENQRAWAVTDRQIQWCQYHGLKTYAGPLLQFDHLSLPDWMQRHRGRFDEVLAAAADYVGAVVTRYRGKVSVWQCAGRLNTCNRLNLSEEDLLRLAARLIETIRQLDPDTPVVISFDQPWAEYLCQQELAIPPIHFADALARAGLGLSGLMLEINAGYFPGGTPLRDPLDFSRQLDYWAIIGLPVHVSLCAPSDFRPDPLAQRRIQLPPESWSQQGQREWIARYLPLMLVKPYVQGVIWNQLSDAQPHEFPHGGVLDGSEQPKPGLSELVAIRHAYLW